jgi:alpha-mannosidase
MRTKADRAGKRKPVKPDFIIQPVTAYLLLPVFPLADGPDALGLEYLPEVDMAPYPGKTVGPYTWQAVRSESGYVDLIRQNFSLSMYCVVYAFVYIHASVASESTLIMGSDDGIAARLNGEWVWKNHTARGYAAEDDMVRVRFRKGWNRLLLKISQIDGGWAFSCRVRGRKAVRFSLRNPLTDQWPGIQNWRPDVRLLNCNLGDIVAPGWAELRISLLNYFSSPAKSVSITVQGPDHKTLATQKLAPLNPNQITTVRCTVPLTEMAHAVRNKQLQIVLKAAGDTKVTPVPEDGVMELIVRLCENDPESPEPLLKKVRLLNRLMRVYHPRVSDIRNDLHRALRAWADGQKDNLDACVEALNRSIIGRQPDRSADIAYVTGHAHIDMNWLWTWEETLKSAQDTFRQVLAFMDEFPDLTFIQSQAHLYKAIEEADPGLFRQIVRCVRQGRWEPAGGMMVEGDTNLPNGEALVRSFLFGQRYFLKAFGQIAKTGWLPDNFGHTAQLPQILKKSGCESYYFHRCRPYLGLFQWEAPDGSRVTAFSNLTYNDTIKPEIAGEFDRIVPKTRRLLRLTGVGDHGGGPTRQDLEQMRMLQETPCFPSLKFSTPRTFFQDSADDPAPVHRGETQYVFEGCYTSVSRIKEGNRLCESRLAEAEWACVWDHLHGGPYPREGLNRVWERVVFNQFHDILPGSAIHESNQDSVAGYRVALAGATGIRDRTLRRIADRIHVDPDKGQPIIVFNPQPRQRTALVEAEIFTHTLPETVRLSGWINFYDSARVQPAEPGEGILPGLLLRDASGRTIPAQIVWGKQFPPGWRIRILFVAENLPAGGYRTFYVNTDEAGEAGPVVRTDEQTFETQFFRIGFNLSNGEINRLYDRRRKIDYGPAGQSLNRLKIYLEDPQSTDAWRLGKVLDVQKVTGVQSVRITENGPVRACVEAVKTWGRSKFIQKTFIYKTYPRIDFHLEAHWFEQGAADRPAPMLRVTFPLKIADPRFNCHVPFYIARRPVTGQEVPAQKWVDVSGARGGLALLNQSKYGHSFQDGELRLTLLRSTCYPDLYPDQGLHRIRYALFPHGRRWKTGVWAEGNDLNGPAMAVEPPSQAMHPAGPVWPEEASFFTISPDNIQMTGLKIAEDSGKVILRLVEITGRHTEAEIRFAQPVRSAARMNLIEQPVEGLEPEIRNDSIHVSVKPYEILTLGVEVKKQE